MGDHLEASLTSPYPDDIPIHEGRPTVVDLQRQAYEAAQEQIDAQTEFAEGNHSLDDDDVDDLSDTPDLDYAPAGTQAGGPKAVPAEEAEGLPEVHFNDLSDQEKFDVMQEAIGFLMGKTQQLEHHLQVMGQTLYRILVKAGEIEEPEESGIVVPDGIVVPGRGRMDVPK